jgi:hypothetical protein
MQSNFLRFAKGAIPKLEIKKSLSRFMESVAQFEQV